MCNSSSLELIFVSSKQLLIKFLYLVGSCKESNWTGYVVADWGI